MAKPVVLILAAGRSERFRAAGGSSDKLDALFTTATGTRSVLDHVIAAAQASGLPWLVVRAADTAHHAEQGMGTSIATGVAATADAPGWLVLPGDLPLVQPSSLQAVAQALAQGHAVVVPEVQGHKGHPVGFASVCRDALMALRGDQGARAVVQAHSAHALPLADIGCITDVDTPELLQQAQAQAQGLAHQTPPRHA